MTHTEALTLLFPAELDGVFAADTALEGAALDAARDNAELLLAEMHPDGSASLLDSWERVCGIDPEDATALMARQDAVLHKLRELGGLSRAYFIALAAYYGWAITIDELLPFMTGIGRCGDRLYENEVRWIWRVNVTGHEIYSFRAGRSGPGERLSWWYPNIELQTLMDDLKPAHTYVLYNYGEFDGTYLETMSGEILETMSGDGLEIY